ncbi:MAG: hypothetical protein U0998_00440 [Moraxellaceae bacterium]|nr:hypothetical protein [Moraxellaceae bacterium]MDZ4385668.1 hypothetical protein [Moraxellaceae bacterium]
MRYELNVQRHRLSAQIHLIKHGHEVKWRIAFRAPGTSCSNVSARSYRFTETALYDASRQLYRMTTSFTETQRQVLLMWLKQIYNNAWVHIPVEARVPLLMSDAVRPSADVLSQFYEDKASISKAQPVSLQFAIVDLTDNAGKRTGMCPPPYASDRMGIELPRAS